MRAAGEARSARRSCRPAPPAAAAAPRPARTPGRIGSPAAAGCGSPSRSAPAGPAGRAAASAPVRWAPSPRLAAHAELAADDRLDAGFRAAWANSRAPNRLPLSVTATAGMRVALAELHQLLDLDRALGQRIGRVDAQMDEIGMGHCRWIILGRRRFVTLAESKCRSGLDEPAVIQREDAVHVVGERQIVGGDQRGQALRRARA